MFPNQIHVVKMKNEIGALIGFLTRLKWFDPTKGLSELI